MYRDETAVGDRVELIRCLDEFTRLEPGDRGTVTFVDDLGTIHVEWDKGTRLGLVPGMDEWRPVEERPRRAVAHEAIERVRDETIRRRFLAGGR